MDVGPLPRRRPEDDRPPGPFPSVPPSGPPPETPPALPTPSAGGDATFEGVFPGRIPTRPESRFRRGVDVVGAALLLVVSSPLLALGAGVVWLAGGRPVLFAHHRVGKGGRPFRCWKLRTMELRAEERLREEPALRRRHREHGFKLPDEEDPRVLRGTEWLRRSHLDELPQLVNVLRGEMSLVGPRPVVRDELACYGEGWRTLLSVRPGLAGAWTAEGARRPPYPERARLELEYVRDRGGVRTDAVLLARNLLALFRRRASG